MKKKLSTKLLIFLMSFCLFVPTLLLSTSTKAETLITINDNEKGWYGTDVYTASSVLQDSVRNYSTGFVLDPSDADNIGITWIQYINYAPVRTATDLYLYKDLPQPIDGGSFSFKINVANAYSHGSFGLEAIAYSANGTAYSLGKMYDDTGLSCGAWLAYSKPMPAGVAVVKMAIRMYVIPNPFQSPNYYPSIPNPSWPGVNYSLLDGIRFDNTAFAETIIRDDETTGWTGTTLRHTQNLDVSTYPFYSVEGNSSMVLRADIMAGANTTNIAAIQKAISPVKNGSFAFKLYSPANTYAGDQRYFANVYATDVNNQSHLIGRFPQAGYLKFSGTGDCSQIFNGWNNFTGALPANLAITNIKIDIIDDSGVPVVDFPFYMDDVKFIGSTSVTLNNINDNEKGWYGTDVYTASSVLQDSVRNYSTGFVLDPSDADNIGITWIQYINYAPVRTATDLYLYKDLPQPIDGGSFSFNINVANAYSHGSFGLEAIAYSANGTAYSLGKMYDDTGLSCGAWLAYSKPMPAGVAVVKIAIRMYVIPNPFQSPNYYPSIPNPSWPGVNYSLLDGIRFDNTAFAETIIRDDEATGWTGTTLRHTQNLDVSTYPFYSVEGNSSMVLRADIMAGANATSNIATIQKAISPVKNGSFAFKLYSPANTYAGDQRYFANVYATDVNNQSHLIGRFPQAGYLKFSGTGDCSQIFNGWNNFTGALPANLAITNIKIDIIDDSGVPVTDFPFYMDDVKFIGSGAVSSDYYVSNTAPGTTVSVLKSQKQSVLGALTVYDKNNVLASDSSLVTTGTKLKSALYNNDYYVVILGDIDKTGVVDISDLAMAKSHLLKATTLTGIELTAARISGKDNVTISDLLAIKKHILNIATINQNRILGEIV